MKTKLLLIALLVSGAHAALVDLTPGGFSENNAPPVFFWLLNTQMQIAGANISGNQVTWSPFEPLGANQFSIAPFGTNAFVSWNTLGTGYVCQYVLVESNTDRANIYAVSAIHPGPVGMGMTPIDSRSTIQAIIFYGGQIVFGAIR
ncbi:MAG TPA: hypothetical protein VGY75_10570 [Candidatus Udaeobacter sp.]|jgi:hypothetical protein|nr:hypothetical protein [Candidatus Udaeobacter sp.]